MSKETTKFKTGAERSKMTGKGRPDLISPYFITRLAKVLETGAEKHGERNWEKGIPFSSLASSAIRHIYQHIEGKTDEDHLAHAAWNLHAMIHFQELINKGIIDKELDNLPHYNNSEESDNVD